MVRAAGGRTFFKSASFLDDPPLLDDPPIQNGVAEVTGGSRVEPREVEPVHHEEAPVPCIRAIEQSDLSFDDVECGKAGIPLEVTSKNPTVIQTAY